MNFYISLPFTFLRFWFFEAPTSILSFFASLNDAFLRLFSLPLLIKTFFRPWKNEYREGLVVFSIAMGMFVKSFVIFADLILFSGLLIFELFLFFFFLCLPFLGFFLFLLT
ncbi:MAG: hypothetical protein M1450_00810 [Patescibacteria group bacterium]|nr:hypothetical protein [Patescibacteria group bacterium]